MTHAFASSVVRLALADFLAWSEAPRAFEEMSAATGVPLVGVTLDESARDTERVSLQIAAAISALPCVLVGLAQGGVDDIGARTASLFDVVLTPASAAGPAWSVGTHGSVEDAFELLARNVQANPVAATSLALLLRDTTDVSAVSGLIRESSTYSALQSGPEFRRWREARAPRHVDDENAARVATWRRDGEFHVRLTRPARRNAYDARMRDALDGALAQALGSDARRIVLSGEGASFCSGGDLDEFGSRADPASAHLVRLSCSPARRMALASRFIEARVHGACVGSGIELAAFATRVVASADSVFRLPEVGMGLIPGAGGTISITRRIGRQRTAYLALSDKTIDAPQALVWGLVDAIGHSHE